MLLSPYKVTFFKNSRTGRVPVSVYLEALPPKVRAKADEFIEYLAEKQGYLDEPYARHIAGPIRELRVDFANGRHRIFFFAFSGQKIVLLHAFLKKTPKTPRAEIARAKANYEDYIQNREEVPARSAV